MRVGQESNKKAGDGSWIETSRGNVKGEQEAVGESPVPASPARRLRCQMRRFAFCSG